MKVIATMQAVPIVQAVVQLDYSVVVTDDRSRLGYTVSKSTAFHQSPGEQQVPK